jgi:heptosyltransferase-2
MRSTPLLARLRTAFPFSHITWITHTPEILPSAYIDELYGFDFVSVYKVSNTEYDIAINLDKDKEACMLLRNVKAQHKFGYIWTANHVAPATGDAERKLITGVFDNISKTNKRHYLEEIFEICGMTFQGEPYLLHLEPGLAERFNYIRGRAGDCQIIGLNTGCGKRWPTRRWPEEYWIELINMLEKGNYYPLLLGGPDEDDRNRTYAHATGASYVGTLPLQEFIALTSVCDVVLTAVSLMMHIAIGLGTPLVLMNNIFNRHEFYLYNNGIIVEPVTGCDCYYGNTCTRDTHCMRDISVDQVYSAISDVSKRHSRARNLVDNSLRK